MVGVFYKLKFRRGCNKLCSGWNHILRFGINLLYPIYCKAKDPAYGLNREQRGDRIVVSLTSFPARLDVVQYTIRSLMDQTCKADRIILWLTEEECANKPLPDSIERLKPHGLEVRYTKTNLRPHNKLYHTLREEPDAVVITADDDVIYAPRLIENLYKAHRENPKSVCCVMAHEITLKDGVPDLYENWNAGADGKAGISDLYVALGVGGVLYPSKCFDEEYFNEELIRKLAFTADDLWLKATEIRLRIPVLKISPHCKLPYTIGGSQKVALTDLNNGMKRNDMVMKNLCDYYHFDWEKIV